jgi:cobalamin biosynthesis protein CobT
LQIKAHKFYRGGKKSGKIHGKNLYRAGLKGAEEYSQRVFRRKHETDTLDTSVCLLVDYSGSMNGGKIIQAVAAAQALGSALGTVGIPCQILGFTERGGNCTIPVFKEYDERYSQKVDDAMTNATNILAHNNDGDAILWAYRGLVKRQSKRKVLVVLSDGAPAGLRGGDYYSYTQRVVKAIEEEGEIEIAGIGIEDMNVEYIYKEHFTINGADQITEALLKTIKRKIL